MSTTTNIRHQFATLATAARYPTLTWHTWAQYPGGKWTYLGASTMEGAANTRGLVRLNGGIAIVRDLSGAAWPPSAVRREVALVLQQLNSEGDAQ